MPIDETKISELGRVVAGIFTTQECRYLAGWEEARVVIRDAAERIARVVNRAVDFDDYLEYLRAGAEVYVSELNEGILDPMGHWTRDMVEWFTSRQDLVLNQFRHRQPSRGTPFPESVLTKALGGIFPSTETIDEEVERRKREAEQKKAG